MQTVKRVLSASLMLALAAVPLGAQTITGTIVGSVTDTTGAVLPGVTVTIAHVQTGRQDVVTSDQQGRFVAALLPVGDYRLEAALEGFRSAARSGVNLTIDQTARVDFTLEVGIVSDVVEVRADAPLLEANTSALGKLVDNRRIAELPLNTRNVYSLIFLTPGVAGSIGNNYNQMSYSVNGARPTMMDTLIDGVSASFPTVNGFSGISVFPSVDAIQEFKVMGANYPSEFGRSLGSVLNVVYKSGTNQLRGSAYEFLRDSRFDANDFFQNRRGVPLGDFSRHQFGGMVSGPVQLSRMFYMASFEGLRERSFASRTFSVPTLLERQGDFSQTLAANGQLIQIFNPFTTRPSPGGTGFIRDPFPGNVIPAELWDPVARNVLQLYPQPNQAGDAVTRRNNYSSTAERQINTNNTDLRLDRNLSDSRRAFVRYSHRYTEDVPPVIFPDDLTIAEGRIIQENRAHNFVAEYSHTISNTTLLTARLGFARTLFVFNNQGLGFQPSSLGLPPAIDQAVDRLMVPRFGASGYVSLGGSDHRYNAFMSYPLLVSLTKILSTHTLKAGFDARLLRVNVWEARAAGTFGFSQNFTQGPDPTRASATAGHSIASLLLGTGTPNNVLIQNWKNVASQSFYLAGYLQDDWQVSSRLTLNLGMRYDFDTPRTERYDRMNFFDPDVRSPLADLVPEFPDLRGGLVFVGVNGRNRQQYQPDTNNLAPRLGAAFRIDDRTVLRGGYAHIFGPSNQAAQGTVGPFGFRTENLWVTSLDGITPHNLLRDPYPNGFQESPGAREGLLTQAGANLQAPLRHQTLTPWNQQWNVTMQRELPWQTALEVAYVGSKGNDLSTNGESGLNLNQLDPAYLALGSALNQLVPNPFYGIVNTGVLAAPVVARRQLLRPFPQFTDVIPLYPSGAGSIYHALQTSFTKRMSAGLQVAGSYTRSRTREDGMSHQNSYDLRASRSLATYDIPHRFVASFLYELPYGRERRFGSSSPAVLEAALGGWQVNGIVTVQSGTPLGIGASNTAGLFNPVTWANSNGQSARLTGSAQDRLQQWFDTSVFSQPAPFTFGNLGFTVDDIRTHGVRNLDLSMFKRFQVQSRVRAEFRVEALNALNTVRFGSPDTNVNSPSFGVVSSQANTPRQLQFGFKVLW